jgi:hypothetical protein
MLTLCEIISLSHLAWRLKMFFKNFWIKRNKARIMIDEAIVRSLMSSYNVLHDAKCGGSFVELFNQVVKLNLEYGNKTHLHQPQM